MTEESTAPDEQGNNNDVQSNGPVNPTVSKTDETQAKIDAAIKARLAEEKRRFETVKSKAIEEALAVAKTEWETERDNHVKTAVDLALKERDLRDVKRTIQAEYGLTDVQLARIAGDDEKSLRTDADALFGLIKQKKAPVINSGGTEQKSQETGPNSELRAWVKATTPTLRH